MMTTSNKKDFFFFPSATMLRRAMCTYPNVGLTAQEQGRGEGQEQSLGNGALSSPADCVTQCLPLREKFP